MVAAARSATTSQDSVRCVTRINFDSLPRGYQLPCWQLREHYQFSLRHNSESRTNEGVCGGSRTAAELCPKKAFRYPTDPERSTKTEEAPYAKERAHLQFR